MRSIHRDVVCEPNQWATWLACSPNMWLTHCSLSMLSPKTGLSACKPCLKYSIIHGKKVQSRIECVKGQWLLTVFDGLQWFSMVLSLHPLYWSVQGHTGQWLMGHVNIAPQSFNS